MVCRYETIDKALDRVDKSLMDDGLKKLMLDDIENIGAEVPRAKVHVNLFGFVFYQAGENPFIMTTLHNGTWIPEIDFGEPGKRRHEEEDRYTGELYRQIFINVGGTWANTFVSRYVADLNRKPENALFGFGPECVDIKAKEFADHYFQFFYLTLQNHLLSKRYKILFDGHSMEPEKNGSKRPEFAIIDKEAHYFLGAFLIRKGYRDIRSDTFDPSISYLLPITRQHVTEVIPFETNKNLYLDESQKAKSKKFEDTRKKVCDAVSDYILRSS